MENEKKYLEEELLKLDTQIGVKNTDDLIRQSFFLWYVSIEGLHLEHFHDETLKHTLRKNYEAYLRWHNYDIDFTFTFGWILNISPWLVRESMTSSEGGKLLRKAYLASPNNVLFKLALRDEIGLSKMEIKTMEKELRDNFYDYFNHGEFIRSYFVDLNFCL